MKKLISTFAFTLSIIFIGTLSPVIRGVSETKQGTQSLQKSSSQMQDSSVVKNEERNDDIGLGITDADTYVWQTAPKKAANIIINYVDVEGNPIPNAFSRTISGNVGELYDATTSQHKLNILGYVLDENQLPTNATGTFTDQPQSVTYVYEQYKDKSTVIVHDSELTVGDTWNPKDNFDSATDAFGGVITFPDERLMVYGEVDTTKVGTYKVTYYFFIPNLFSISENQGTRSAIATITVKDDQPAKGRDITARYINTDGNKISENIVKSGNIGEDYTTEQKDIDGYTFKEVQGNVSGQFTNQAQTVTYIYTKNLISGADVTAKYVDTDGNSISEDIVKSGNIGDDYSTKQKEIAGYAFKEVQGNVSGQFTNQAQTVTYVYTKSKVIPESKTDDKTKDKEDTYHEGITPSVKDALPETGESEKMALINVYIGFILLVISLIITLLGVKKFRN